MMHFLLLLLLFVAAAPGNSLVRPRAHQARLSSAIRASRKDVLTSTIGGLLVGVPAVARAGPTLEELAAMEQEGFRSDFARVIESFDRARNLLESEKYQEFRVVLRSYPFTTLRGASYRAANAAVDPAEARKARDQMLGKVDRFDGSLNAAREGKEKDNKKALDAHAAILVDLKAFLSVCGLEEGGAATVQPGA